MSRMRQTKINFAPVVKAAAEHSGGRSDDATPVTDLPPAMISKHGEMAAIWSVHPQPPPAAASTSKKLTPGRRGWTALDRGACVGFWPKWMDLNRAHALYNRLLKECEWEQQELDIMGRKVMQPRLVAYYSTDTTANYPYSGIMMVPHAMDPELGGLMDELQQLLGTPLNSVLLNLYRDGSDGVAWHADNEKLYHEVATIASLSLGSARDFHVRRKVQPEDGPRLTFPLGMGDLLVMKGTMQKHWEHSIPKRAPPHLYGPRISLTFRYVAFPGRTAHRRWQQQQQEQKQHTGEGTDLIPESVCSAFQQQHVGWVPDTVGDEVTLPQGGLSASFLHNQKLHQLPALGEETSHQQQDSQQTHTDESMNPTHGDGNSASEMQSTLPLKRKFAPYCLATAPLSKQPDKGSGSAVQPAGQVSRLALSEPPQLAPAQPGPAQPAPTQPVPAQPGPAQPGPAQPAPTQPAPAQPGPAQPGPAQPAPTQPAPAQPGPGSLASGLQSSEIVKAVSKGLVTRGSEEPGLYHLPVSSQHNVLDSLQGRARRSPTQSEDRSIRVVLPPGQQLGRGLPAQPDQSSQPDQTLIPAQPFKPALHPMFATKVSGPRQAPKQNGERPVRVVLPPGQELGPGLPAQPDQSSQPDQPLIPVHATLAANVPGPRQAPKQYGECPIRAVLPPGRQLGPDMLAQPDQPSQPDQPLLSVHATFAAKVSGPRQAPKQYGERPVRFVLPPGQQLGPGLPGQPDTPSQPAQPLLSVHATFAAKVCGPRQAPKQYGERPVIAILPPGPQELGPGLPAQPDQSSQPDQSQIPVHATFAAKVSGPRQAPKQYGERPVRVVLPPGQQLGPGRKPSQPNRPSQPSR